MRINLFFGLLMGLLSSCFFAKKETLPLPQSIMTIVKSENKIYTNIQYKNDQYQTNIDKKRHFLNQKSIIQWFDQIRKIEQEPLKGKYDLSKSTHISTLEFTSSLSNLRIELYRIQERYFMKYHYKNREKNIDKRFASLLSSKDDETINHPIETFKNVGLSLPQKYQKISYHKKDRVIFLAQELADKTYQCLRSFQLKKVLYHGNIAPQEVARYSIGKNINANIAGYLTIHLENDQLPIHFGKAVENPIIVRIWPRHQQQILEGNLPCFSLIRSLDQLK